MEIIDEGRNGLSVPPGDAAALATVLRRLVDSPELVAGLQRTTVARPRSTADFATDLEKYLRRGIGARAHAHTGTHVGAMPGPGGM